MRFTSALVILGVVFASSSNVLARPTPAFDGDYAAVEARAPENSGSRLEARALISDDLDLEARYYDEDWELEERDFDALGSKVPFNPHRFRIGIIIHPNKPLPDLV